MYISFVNFQNNSAQGFGWQHLIPAGLAFAGLSFDR